MKKVLILLLLFQGCLIRTKAQSNVWTGAVSTDWNTAGNWSLGVVPDSVANVDILTVSTVYPVLSSDVRMNSINVHYAQLTLGSHQLKSFNIDFQNSAIYSTGGSMEAVSLSGWKYTQTYGKLSIELEYGVINGGNVFNGDFSIHMRQCTHCDTYWWPKGYLYLSSNTGGDLFKGVTRISTADANIQIGAFPSTITFEKKTEFEISKPSSGTNTLYFADMGSRVVFKDTVSLRANEFTDVRFSSVMNFEKAAIFDIRNANCTSVRHYDYFTPPYDGHWEASQMNFYGDVLFNMDAGFFSFGSGHLPGSIRNTATFYGTARLKAGASGMKEGTLQLINATFNGPQQIICDTYPSMSAFKTGLNLAFVQANADLSLKADHITLGTTEVAGRTLIHRDGGNYGNPGDARYAYSPGGNTFHEAVEYRMTSGMDWIHAPEESDTYNDSLRLHLAGDGQRALMGTRGAVFSLGSAGGTQVKGPLIVENGPSADGDFYLGTSETAKTIQLEGPVNLAGVSTSNVTINQALFNGPDRVHQLKLGGSGNLLSILSGVIEGASEIEAQHLKLTNSYFMKPSLIKKTGSGDDLNYGGNTFYKSVRFLNTAGWGDFRLISGEDRLVK